MCFKFVIKDQYEINEGYKNLNFFIAFKTFRYFKSQCILAPFFREEEYDIEKTKITLMYRNHFSLDAWKVKAPLTPQDVEIYFSNGYIRKRMKLGIHSSILQKNTFEGSIPVLIKGNEVQLVNEEDIISKSVYILSPEKWKEIINKLDYEDKCWQDYEVTWKDYLNNILLKIKD